VPSAGTRDYRGAIGGFTVLARGGPGVSRTGLVLIEPGPRRSVLHRLEQRAHLVALDGQFGDPLLYPHRDLYGTAGRCDREFAELLRELAGLFDGSDRQAHGDPHGQRQGTHNR
jgi:hypothetical protein